MAKRYTQEYIQWLKDNHFSHDDETRIQNTAFTRTLIWFLLSCIPGLGLFVLPLMLNAWTMYKIVKQKSFEPRPGILYSICVLAMYISFILIIPLLIWILAKKYSWGTGLRGLIKRGKVGQSQESPCETDSETESVQHASKNSAFPTIIIVVLLLAALLLLGGYLTKGFGFFPFKNGTSQGKDPNHTTSSSTPSSSPDSTDPSVNVEEAICGSWYCYGTVRQDSDSTRSIDVSRLHLRPDHTFVLDEDLCVSSAEGAWEYQEMYHWGFLEGEWHIEGNLLFLTRKIHYLEELDDDGKVIIIDTTEEVRDDPIGQIEIQDGTVMLITNGDVSKQGFVYYSHDPYAVANDKILLEALDSRFP